MLNPDKVRKPFRKLRRALKDFTAQAPPYQVHTLRTEMRRLEAVLALLSMDIDGPVQKLKKTLKPFRRSAGRVRDMDALISKVLTLGDSQGQAALVELVQYLARRRSEQAAHLAELIAEHGAKARKRLKGISRHLKMRLEEAKPEMDSQGAGVEILATQIRFWPKLEETNLHGFRICVKELHYMLQLDDGANHQLLASLKRVKDAIGEWHDGTELRRHARKALEDQLKEQSNRDLLNAFDAGVRQNFATALALSKALRRDYFGAQAPAGRKGPTLVTARSA